MNKYHNVKKVVDITDPTWNYIDKSFSPNFEEILFNAPGYIFWKDINSVYMGGNKNAARLYGVYSINDLIGKTDYDFNQKYAAEFIKQDKYVLNTGNHHVSEKDIITLNDGSIRLLRTEKKPLYDKYRQIIGIVGIAIDVTNEIENQKLKIQNIENQTQIQVNKTLIQCLQDIHHTIENYKLEVLNNKVSHYNKNQPNTTKLQNIKLTKREREIIYFLSLNKNSKEIAQILSVLENKNLSPSTILSIIDKKLYLKFGVNSISALVEIANKLKLIPFVL
jgi:PAS domain S-box-containing protein